MHFEGHIPWISILQHVYRQLTTVHADPPCTQKRLSSKFPNWLEGQRTSEDVAPEPIIYCGSLLWLQIVVSGQEMYDSPRPLGSSFLEVVGVTSQQDVSHAASCETSVVFGDEDTAHTHTRTHTAPQWLKRWAASKPLWEATYPTRTESNSKPVWFVVFRETLSSINLVTLQCDSHQCFS